jgi:dTMP kinase
MNSHSGKLISFEGGEAVGKTTQIQRFCDRLQAEYPDRKIVRVREPGGTPASEHLRNLIKFDPLFANRSLETEVFLFLAARSDLVPKLIRPALDEGAFVVCDRFIDSTVVYQGFVSGVPVERLQMLNDMATGGLRPDLTILLQVSDEVAKARLMNADRERGCHFEKKPITYHQGVRAGYLRLAQENPDRVRLIDGAHSQDEVAAAVWATFLKKMDESPLPSSPS